MKIEEIYTIPVDGNGWRILPDGNYVTLGDGVKLGNYVTLGDGVTLGNYVTLGDGVKLGNYVKLGDGVKLGNHVKLGNYVTLGDGVKLGNYVTLGDGVTLGDYVKLKQSPLAVQGSKHLVVHTGPHLIQVGCTTHTFSEWIKHFKKIGEAEGYTPDQIDEYKRILDFIIASTQDGVPK